MIKAHKIISMQMIHLHCDNCDTNISNNINNRKLVSEQNTETNSPHFCYEYICPSCGTRYRSDTSYPFQSVNFESEGHKFIDDNEVIKL